MHCGLKILKNDVQKDEEKYNEELERVDHNLLKSISFHGENLKADWSIYANIYDRPYEWWATPYHLGNIQANTVDGTWNRDEKNSIM